MCIDYTESKKFQYHYCLFKTMRVLHSQGGTQVAGHKHVRGFQILVFMFYTVPPPLFVYVTSSQEKIKQRNKL